MANTEENNIAVQLKPLFPKHNFNKLYYKQDIVTYQINGTTNFYQAIRNVPRYVPITDRTYWNLLTTGTDNFVDDEPDQPAGPDYLCFTANKAGATLMLVGAYLDYDGKDFALEYSTDGENWENLEITKELDESAPIVYYNAASSIFHFSSEGDKVYFRGNNINGSAYVNIDGELDTQEGYYFAFCGDPTTNTEDNEFSVSGDLQTIVDKTGTDKEHGCFGYSNGKFGVGLFTNFGRIVDHSGILITSAPDLTATTLIPSKYFDLFGDQTLLEEPANMPNFTTNDLPADDDNVGCFSYMYVGCTSIEEPADFNNLSINSLDDLNIIRYNLDGIYCDTIFNITDDNGDTLNGFAGLTFPYEFDGTELTSYSFAETINNTNGFASASDNPINIIIPTSPSYEVARVDFYAGKIAIPLTSSVVNGETVYDANTSHYELPTSPLGIVIEIYSSSSIYGWLYSTDGVNWSTTELQATDRIEIDIPTEGNHYYKPDLTNPK